MSQGGRGAGKEDSAEADSEAGQNNAQGNQGAQLRGLFAADLREVDFFGCARERRLPMAPLVKVAKRSQQMVADG